MRYVVAYDIRSDRRRRKVLHLLKDYGIPVQLSVVECEISRDRLEELRRELSALVQPRSDRVSFFAQCEACVPRSLRLGAAPRIPTL